MRLYFRSSCYICLNLKLIHGSVVELSREQYVALILARFWWKSSPDDDRTAHTYLALVSSGLLQERLLLRYLTDEAQSVGEGELRLTIDCVPDESTTRERGSEEGWGKRTFRSGKALYLEHYNPERLRGVEKPGQLHKRMGNQGL